MKLRKCSHEAFVREDTEQKGQPKHLPRRWGIWFAVHGDLKFLSHHDMMRAIERAAVRAELPLRYTQGFNPHPILSVACPRPVGVAGDRELLVFSLADTEPPLDGEELLSRLNASAPEGLRFTEAQTLRPGRAPRPCRALYELRIEDPSRRQAVDGALDRLRAQDAWCVQRCKPPKHRRQAAVTRTIDLRPLVGSIAREGDRLVWMLRPQGDLWARPGELLDLLGLDGRIDLAAVVRTQVVFDGASRADGE